MKVVLQPYCNSPLVTCVGGSIFVVVFLSILPVDVGTGRTLSYWDVIGMLFNVFCIRFSEWFLFYVFHVCIACRNIVFRGGRVYY